MGTHKIVVEINSEMLPNEIYEDVAKDIFNNMDFYIGVKGNLVVVNEEFKAEINTKISKAVNFSLCGIHVTNYSEREREEYYKDYCLPFIEDLEQSIKEIKEFFKKQEK